MVLNVFHSNNNFWGLKDELKGDLRPWRQMNLKRSPLGDLNSFFVEHVCFEFIWGYHDAWARQHLDYLVLTTMKTVFSLY